MGKECGELGLRDWEKERYLRRVEEVQERLLSEGIPYRVLGSVAVTSYVDSLGLGFSVNRENAFKRYQRYPDIDVLVQRHDIPRAKKCVGVLMNDREYPLCVEFLIPELFVDLRLDSDVSYLTHKEMKVGVETDLFGPATTHISNTPITTSIFPEYGFSF